MRRDEGEGKGWEGKGGGALAGRRHKLLKHSAAKFTFTG